MTDMATYSPHGHETYRHCIQAHLPPGARGGACSLLVRRIDNRIELLHHATLATGATLTRQQAHEIAHALITAAEPSPETEHHGTNR